MAESKRANDQISYRNRKKQHTDFSSKDLRRSNCYNCDFTGSNFNETSFRGAQFKACTFRDCTFEGAELVAANLKNSQFGQVKFQNTLFDSVSLEGANFEGAEFDNVIFVGTDLSKAAHLELEGQKVQVFDQMPVLEMSEELKDAVKTAMKNEFVKYARVLDTKEGKINPVSMMVLLNQFDEETLIKGLKTTKRKINKDFCTLGTIVEAIKAYEAEGLLD